METTIKVAAVDETQWTCGPGRFLTVWVQGCEKRCPGCINAAYLPLVNRWWVTAESLLDRLVPGFHEGICFSGGEPFLQAEALGDLAERARDAGFGTVSYSGYTLEELETNQPAGARRLLAALDLLIDGEFVQKQARPLLFRGSENQRIHLLSSRYPRSMVAHPPVTEAKLDADGKLTTIGTGNQGLRLILALLNEQGWHTSGR